MVSSRRTIRTARSPRTRRTWRGERRPGCERHAGIGRTGVDKVCPVGSLFHGMAVALETNTSRPMRMMKIGTVHIRRCHRVQAAATPCRPVAAAMRPIRRIRATSRLRDVRRGGYETCYAADSTRNHTSQSAGLLRCELTHPAALRPSGRMPAATAAGRR